MSEDRPPFIIAEAGVNHNEQPEMAMDLIRAAADAGADAIKFQNYDLNHILTFHSRVKRAKDFSSTLVEVNDVLPTLRQPSRCGSKSATRWCSRCPAVLFDT